MDSPPPDQPPAATVSLPPDRRAAAASSTGDDDTIPSGTQLGRYVVVASLGGGGMSTVYRADDTTLGRQVALKVLRPELARHLAANQRFAREGRTMAQLSHAHVATLFDMGHLDGHYALAMELLEGGTLRSWLTVPRPWRAVVAMFSACARGLAAAHDLGIVHRDFKPDNVLLTRDGVPRVSDFGLAASAVGRRDDGRVVTVPGTVLGTPAYMAPEQREGRAVDARADQWSLCLAWLEALGRDRATTGGARGDARGPRWLIRILLRGLERDPARRWPSVAALLAAIERRRMRGRAARALAAGVAAAAAIAAVAWSRRAPAAPPPAGEPAIVQQWRQVPGDSGKLMLAADGHAVVRTTSQRDSLLLTDDRDTASRPLPLPPGRISTRSEAIAAVSEHADVVVVRMEDGSVWRTGPGVTAPVLLRARGNGPVCLHPSGTRVAISALDRDQRIEIRAVDDGRVLATAPHGDLCTWLGDRLVLGFRDGDDAPIRLSLVDVDGTVRPLPPLPGVLGTMTADGGRLLVAHTVGSGPDLVGFLTRVDVDGFLPPTWLMVEEGTGLGPVAVTARGLFVGRVAVFDGRKVGALPAGDGPVELRSVENGRARAAAAEWLSPATLAFGDRGRVFAQRVTDGQTRVHAEVPGSIFGRVGSELLVRQPLAAVDGAEGCRVVAIGPAGARALPAGGCGYNPRCDGNARCVVGTVDGDQVRFGLLDPATGTIGAPLVARPLSGTPHVDPGVDGRWLVESGGLLTVVDPATGSARALATAGLTVDDASWSHGQRDVIAVGQDAQGFALARVSLDGTHAILARSTAAPYLTPRVAPDGGWITVVQSLRIFEYALLAR